MRILIALIAITAALSGCTTTWNIAPNAREQQQKLSFAIKLLKTDKTKEAKKTLSEIATRPAVAGITDEALFRLALLDLETNQEKIATDKASIDLDTILKKFSSGSWSIHATSLKNLIDAYDVALQEKAELDRLVKNLKSSNVSLMKENADLRQDLEKIKRLDLELEMKKKR